MSETITKDELPTSFGTFNPIGNLMLGMPDAMQVDALNAALHAAGWPIEDLVQFTPSQSIATFEALNESASAAAGFGFEITLQRRYLKLAREGYGWLLVKVEDVEHAARAVAIARAQGATLAVHYRALVVEELI